MSISDLMLVSYILFAAAILFLLAATVMFFKFDIRRIHKILKSAASPQASVMRAGAAKHFDGDACISKSKSTKTLDSYAKTELLDENSLPEQCDAQRHTQTLPLGTVSFMLIQDITYTHDKTDELA